MAVRTDVATALRRTLWFRLVAVARLGSIEAQGQGEANGKRNLLETARLRPIMPASRGWPMAALRGRTRKAETASAGSSALRREEEASNLARSSLGWPMSCQHGSAREGAESHGDGDEQRGEKRRKKRHCHCSLRQFWFFSNSHPSIQKHENLL